MSPFELEQARLLLPVALQHRNRKPARRLHYRLTGFLNGSYRDTGWDSVSSSSTAKQATLRSP
ncbi:hypothetical protein [Lonsdalea populi]|uniref:hypothetical protein n=1 Tax=Lonsdalea populi TaxID=1172565 RepID=UPI0011BD9F22|nr:hypothetical protein [Lonsdalea populi]